MIHEQLAVFWRFMWRDLYVHRQRLSSYIINSVIIRPLCLIVCLGYVFQKAGMVAVSTMPRGAFFAGVPVMYLFSLAVSINFEFLTDYEQDRHGDFQRMILAPSWLIVQKIIMGTLVLFCCSVPFFPLAKLIMQELFAIAPHGLVYSAGMLLLVCWLTTALLYVVGNYIRRMRELPMIWRTLIYPMFMLGGSLVPWQVAVSWWPAFGYALLANPYIYVTEGFRQSLFDSPMFFSLSLCITMVVFYATLFTMLAIWLYRRKVDAV